IFRARSTRVEGTVVAHGSRGRPIVAYQWNGEELRHTETGPIEPLAVGEKVGVYIPPEGPAGTRPDWAIGLLFMPGWCCLMPAMFFAAYGVAVAARGARQPARFRPAPGPAGGFWGRRRNWTRGGHG